MFTDDRREALQWFQDWARNDPSAVHQLAISWADQATRELDDSQRILLEAGATLLSALIAGTTLQQPKKKRSRTFTAGERLGLPSGEKVYAQVTLSADAAGVVEKFRVTPDGVLAGSGLPNHVTYMDEHGLAGGGYVYDLTALDVDDLQPLPPS